MKHLILTFFLLLVLHHAQAQPDTVNLEDITITVTPFEQRLSESTGSLSIIRPLPEAFLPAINPAGQLNTAPGVFMASGTHTTNRLTIRGVGSRSPYNTNRIRAYFEEIPLTNGDGVSTLEDLDLLGVSRIEILKGPASAMYGSGLGGVVMLKAKVPAGEGFSGILTAGGGSFQTRKYGLSAKWKKGGTRFSLGTAHASTVGFRENSRYCRNNLFLHAKTGNQNHQYTFHLLVTNLFAQIPSSLDHDDYTESPQQAADSWLNISGFESYTKLTTGAGWSATLSPRWKNQLTLFASWLDPYESRPFNILDDRAFSAGIREALQFTGNHLKIRSGFEIFGERYSWEIFETLMGTPGNLQLRNRELRQYGNLFSHASWSPVPDLHMEAGVNLNMLEYSLKTIYHYENTDQSGRYSYHPVLSPRLGINYKTRGGHSLHASAGHGFSAPSLEETLLPEGLVNPDLLPETGWNLDAGIRGRSSRDTWFYDITCYTVIIRNMLVTERVTEEAFSGINAGSARLTGLEVFGGIQFPEPGPANRWQHRFTTSITISDNRFTRFIDDGTSYTGNHLPGIPAHIVHTQLISRYRKQLMLLFELSGQGKQYLNDSNLGSYPGHIVAHARSSFTIHPEKLPFQVRLNGGINNITNTAYASMILVNAPSFGGSAPRSYYPGMPRHFFLGISLER